MLRIIDENTLYLEADKQIVQFSTDGKGDYYFTIYSDNKSNGHSFFVDKDDPIYNLLKWFLEQEISYSKDSEIMSFYGDSPYFVINENSITIADQNKPKAEAGFLKLILEKDKIQLTFSDKFPSSIRINGLGRKDHYPFFLPVIDLFNILQNFDLINTIKGTACYQSVNSGNTVSITGDGGNAWGYFGPAYKKLAPSLKLYEYWRDNPEHLSDEELIDYYIQEYFQHRLMDLEVIDLLSVLKEKFGQEIILLCHEQPGVILSRETFCHRRIVADFIELKSGIIIPEIKNDSGNNIIVNQFDYKPKLRELIRKP